MFTGRFSSSPKWLGSRFSGATFEPNAGLPAAEVSTPITRSEVSAPEQPELLARLWSLQPQNPELLTRLHRLLDEFAPLWAEAEELENLILHEQREALEQEHRSIRKAGRELDKRYKQLAREYQDAEQDVQNAGLRKESLIEQLQGLALLQKKGQHVSRWADDREVAEWNSRVEQAKSLVPDANQRFADAVAHRNDVASKLEAARAELEKLGAEEIRLRRQLQGRPFVDPELGLETEST